jgi:PilZ domain
VATRLRNLLNDPGTETSAVEKQSAEKPSQENESAKKENLIERRVFSRLDCEIPAQVLDKSGSRLNGLVSDISLRGCFLETRNTIPVGSEIALSLEGKAGISSQGLVRSQQTRGMGIEFILMTAPNFRRLQYIAKGSVRLR